MAVNRRYLSSPWRQTSSLYRASQSAKNLKDEEMKFKWDFSVISNDDYMTYVQGRLKEQTDPSDVMKWERTQRTVQKEIRSDNRALDFLRISQMPGNTSAKAKARVDAYWKLAESAYEDGDNDAYISAMTSYNNAFDAWQNKLGAEARAGSSSAKKALNKQYTLEKNAFQREEFQIKSEFADDPLRMAALLTDLNIRKGNAAINFANAVGQYDDQGNKFEDTVLQAQKMYKLAEDMAGKVAGDFDIDASGNITGFKPKFTYGPQGEERLNPGEGYSMVQTQSGMKLEKEGKYYSIKQDADGNSFMDVEDRPRGSNLAEMIDPDTGQKYFSETFTPDKGREFNEETGLWETKDKDPDRDPMRDKIAFNLQGNQMRYNQATNKFDLWENLDEQSAATKAIGTKRTQDYLQRAGVTDQYMPTQMGTDPRAPSVDYFSGNINKPSVMTAGPLRYGTRIDKDTGKYVPATLAGQKAGQNTAEMSEIITGRTAGTEQFHSAMFPETVEQKQNARKGLLSPGVEKKQKELAKVQAQRIAAAKEAARIKRINEFVASAPERRAELPKQVQRVANVAQKVGNVVTPPFGAAQLGSAAGQGVVKAHKAVQKKFVPKVVNFAKKVANKITGLFRR